MEKQSFEKAFECQKFSFDCLKINKKLSKIFCDSLRFSEKKVASKCCVTDNFAQNQILIEECRLKLEFLLLNLLRFGWKFWQCSHEKYWKVKDLEQVFYEKKMM